MKKLYVAALLACALTAQAGETRCRVIVRNPSDLARTRETIALPLDSVRALLQAPDLSLIVVREKGTSLVSQVTEGGILFQSDFAPRESKSFELSVARRRPLPPASPVYGMFVRPREDYAWENDLIAFRMYGPALAAEVNNGIDVWTKRVRYPIVAKWYKESEGSAPGKDTYHTDRGEGGDFFAVGRSLGAGGSGFWINGRVLQPGTFAEQKTIDAGPVRVTFDLTYLWTVGGVSFSERKRISLDAGQYLNRIEVSFDGTLPAGSMAMACGLVKRAGAVRSYDAAGGWCGLWGPTTGDSAQGSLGTGILLESDVPAIFIEDSVQYLVVTRSWPSVPFVYFAGAGWSLNGVQGEKEWNAILRGAAAARRAPLRVSLARIR